MLARSVENTLPEKWHVVSGCPPEFGAVVRQWTRQSGALIVPCQSVSEALEESCDQRTAAVVVAHGYLERRCQERGSDPFCCRARRLGCQARIVCLGVLFDARSCQSCAGDTLIEAPETTGGMAELSAAISEPLCSRSRAVHAGNVSGGQQGVLRKRPMRSLYVSGSRLELTKRQFDLMFAFLRREGSVVSFDELCWTVCGTRNSSSGARVVHRQVSELARRIAGTALAIENVRSVGYRLTRTGSRGGSQAVAVINGGLAQQSGVAAAVDSCNLACG